MDEPLKYLLVKIMFNSLKRPVDFDVNSNFSSLVVTRIVYVHSLLRHSWVKRNYYFSFDHSWYMIRASIATNKYPLFKLVQPLIEGQQVYFHLEKREHILFEIYNNANSHSTWFTIVMYMIRIFLASKTNKTKMDKKKKTRRKKHQIKPIHYLYQLKIKVWIYSVDKRSLVTHTK